MGDGDRHFLALDQRLVLEFDLGVNQLGLARGVESSRTAINSSRAICRTRARDDNMSR